MDPRSKPRSERRIYPGSHPIGRLHFNRRDNLKKTIGVFPMSLNAAKRSAARGHPVVRVGGYAKPGHGPNARPRLVDKLPKRTTPLAWKMWHPGYKFDYVPGKKPLTDRVMYTHEAYTNNKDGQVPFDYWHKQGHKPGERLVPKAAVAATEGAAKKKKSSSGAAGKKKREPPKIRVQSFGKKKTATAVAFVRNGRGAVKINSQPIKLLQPEQLRYKIYEPILVAGEGRFRELDMRIRVSGGGHTSQVYAIRQAMAKALVAYYAKYKDASSALELKKLFIAYDRTLLISDPRRMEAKKFGGRGARARRQKSYR